MFLWSLHHLGYLIEAEVVTVELPFVNSVSLNRLYLRVLTDQGLKTRISEWRNNQYGKTIRRFPYILHPQEVLGRRPGTKQCRAIGSD